MILRPANPSFESITKIEIIDSKTINLYYPQYSEQFRQLVKYYNFTWFKSENYYKRCWTRTLNNRSGLLEDRLIEICYKLLEANFIIDLPDNFSSLIEQILEANYQDEQTCWLTCRSTGKYQNWIVIDYNRKRENFYKQARLLPNTRYDKPWVVVSPIYYDQILDFASLYNFSITEKAKLLLDKAKQEKLQQVRVELKTRIDAKKGNIAFGAEKKNSATSESIGVLDEFQDQD